MTGVSEKRKKPIHKSNLPAKHEGNKVYTNSPIVKAFEQYSAELDAKHDKYERLVKLSRDITIASKRIIFAIHALLRSSNYNEDVEKIKESFKTIHETHLKAVAKELENDDHYQFIRAFFWGLQEYIEAITFFHYVTSGTLFNYEDLAKTLTFQVDNNLGTSVDGTIGSAKDSSVNKEAKENDCTTLTHVNSDSQPSTRTISLNPEVPDYILGVLDLTGELMRHCINSFAANHLNNGYTACNFVRQLYSAMLFLTNVPSKEFYKKFIVARQSMEKMEMACYTTRVRGSEALTFQAERAQDDFDSYSYYD